MLGSRISPDDLLSADLPEERSRRASLRLHGMNSQNVDDIVWEDRIDLDDAFEAPGLVCA